MEVSLISLWLPIVLSTVGVFIASSLIWTVVQYHNSDWQQLPDEDAVRAAVKGTPPGQYTFPYAGSYAVQAEEEWQNKAKEGPNGMVTIVPTGIPNMTKSMGQWFLYCFVMSILIGYVASATLGPGTEYLKVFQVTCTTAFLAYAGAAPLGAIWFGHTWSRTVKDLVDGLVYALLTAGLFGWLWPGG